MVWRMIFLSLCLSVAFALPPQSLQGSPLQASPPSPKKIQPAGLMAQGIKEQADLAALLALKARLSRDYNTRDIRIAPEFLARIDQRTYVGNALIQAGGLEWIPISFRVVLGQTLGQEDIQYSQRNFQ